MPQLKKVSVDILLHSHQTYRLGEAGKNYSDINLFARHIIPIQWQASRHSVNPQNHGIFSIHLSVLDLLQNSSKERPVMLAFSVEEEEK